MDPVQVGATALAGLALLLLLTNVCRPWAAAQASARVADAPQVAATAPMGQRSALARALTVPAMSPGERAAAFARISSSRSPQDAIAAFAGGALPHTILSSCHSTLLDMFDTRTVLPLRITCRDSVAAVAAHSWDDPETVIRGNVGPVLLTPGPGVQLGAWRGCFPRARGANVSGYEKDYSPGGRRRTPVVDADFVHLEGLRRLNMAWCLSVSDAAFVHLVGIQSLNMSGCWRSTITDAAFVPLSGIQSLIMRNCHQSTITDAAFVHLAGIQILSISHCRQPTITDAAFMHLRGIHTLIMDTCFQFTDAAFVHLNGIHHLNIDFCTRITGNAIEQLGCNLEYLSLNGCSDSCVKKAIEMYGEWYDAFPYPKFRVTKRPQGCSPLNGGKRKITTKKKKSKNKLTKKLKRR